MTVKVSKPKFNIREKLSELDKPSGIKGNELLRSETAQDVRNAIGAGRKNKVINGDMRIAQRGTTFSIGGNAGDNYTLDRFKLQTNNLDEAEATVTQDSSAPDGFSKSLKIQCDTAESSVGNGEHARLMYDGEAFDFTDVGFGTKSAKRITVSFWVKSNLTGKWGMNFWRGDANRSNLRTYTINQANTWEHKVITLSADTTGGVVNSDNGYGFRINWGLAAGADMTTAHSLDTWHGFQQQYFYPYESRNTNFFSSTSNNFYLTGVQCEVSDVATEFEHRPYAEEIVLCQRYFAVFPGRSGGIPFWQGYMGASYGYCSIPIPYNMRAVPTPTDATTGTSSSDGNIYDAGGVNIKSHFAGNGTVTLSCGGYAPSGLGLIMNFGNHQSGDKDGVVASWNGATPGIFLNAEL